MRVKPIPEGFQAEEKDRMVMPDGKIMHAEVMTADSPFMIADPKNGSKAMNAGFYLYVNNADEVYEQALKAGAVSLWNQRISSMVIEMPEFEIRLAINGGLVHT